MKRSLLVAYLAIFACALAIRLWFVLCDGHLAVSAVGDSSEYLRDAAALSQLLLQNKFGDPVALKGIEEMMKQAGIVFPAFLALGYALTGHVADGYSVNGPVILQSLVSALSCILVGLTASKCWNARVGVTAAILASLYPGFIVNNVRVLGENLAVFLISAVALFTVYLVRDSNSKTRPYLALGLGISLALLQLTRPALILTLVPVLIVLCFQIRNFNREFLKISMLVLLGLALTVSPSMYLQKISTGTAGLMPDRRQNFNLLIGLDTNTRGWITYPFGNFSQAEGKSAPEILVEKMKNPTEFAQLMLDKPARLLKFHWNDFRLPIGNIGMDDQIFFHQLVLLLCSLGVALGFFVKTQEERNSVICRGFLLSLILMHSAYFFFSTLPRYGLSAMPFILMFAACGLHIVYNLISNAATRKYGLLLGGSALFLLILLRYNGIALLRSLPGVTHFNTAQYIELTLRMLIYVLFTDLLFRISKNCHNIASESRYAIVTTALLLLPFTVPHLPVHGRLNEWRVTLNPKFDRIEQEIKLPKDKIDDLLSRDCFLIIDCQNWHGLGQNANIFIDGQKLESPVFPLMPFVQNLRHIEKFPDNTSNLEMEYLFSGLMVGTGGTLPDLRQWYAISVPPSLIGNLAGKDKAALKIEIVNKPERNQKSLFYGTYVPKRHQVIIPGMHFYSWDKTICGVECADDFSDPRFDEKYLLTDLSEGGKDLSPDSGFQSGSYNIRLLAAPKSVPAVRQFRMQQTSESFSSGDLNLQLELKRRALYDRQSIWIATFKGVLDSTGAHSFSVPVEIMASARAGDEEFLTCFVPSSLQVQQRTNELQFSFPLCPSALGSPISSVQIKMKEGGRAKSSQYFGKTNYTAEDVKGLSWRDCVLNISEIGTNPLGEGFEIY